MKTRTIAIDRSFDQLTIGLVESFACHIDDATIDAFAEVSSDRNDLHVDAAYARSRGFPDRVSHGMLVGSKFSALVGMFLPGRRCLLLEMNVSFPNPVFPGDDIIVSGEVTELWPEQAMMKIRLRATKSFNNKDVVVARGAALCRTLY